MLDFYKYLVLSIMSDVKETPQTKDQCSCSSCSCLLAYSKASFLNALTYFILFHIRLLLPENREVASKLGIATALMFTFPIITFYICFYFIFHGKEEPLAWSGFAAVGAANIVVAGYVYSAFSESDEEFLKDQKRMFDNDESGPRVGAFKQRTD